MVSINDIDWDAVRGSGVSADEAEARLKELGRMLPPVVPYASYILYEELGRHPVSRWQRARRWVARLMRWR